MKHTITRDEMFKDKVVLSYEHTIAMSCGYGENKELIIRTSISGLSDKNDVLYIVKDNKKPELHRIQIITSHLDSAIAAYNRI